MGDLTRTIPQIVKSRIAIYQSDDRPIPAEILLHLADYITRRIGLVHRVSCLDHFAFQLTPLRVTNAFGNTVTLIHWGAIVMLTYISRTSVEHNMF